jgi:tRNA(adenine34) deaminase
MQEVAVGVLTEARRVFIGQRRATARYGGMWEFPGGKIERGESPVGALGRELREELGIEIAEPRYLGTVEHRYDDGGTFRVWYYRVEQWHGTPVPKQWERAAWVSIEELPSYAMFEANRAILPALAASFESDDERFMRIALAEAERAARCGEVPVGCVITMGGAIIARAHNRTEELRTPVAHAELLAIRQALTHSQTRWLDGATLYVTLEPCPMCAGAIVLARIARVVFGAHDPKAGACETLYTLASDPRLNHRAAVRGGVLTEQSQALLKAFFRDHCR